MLASRGTFSYEDHGTPWGIAARGLRVSVTKGIADRVYRGGASFADSVITIQKYEPFHANMQSRFTVEGSHLQFSGIDLVSEGARSKLVGQIDFSRWPEQTYQIVSSIDFPTQKSIYFHQYAFQASGQGKFQGTFHLFSGGRELKGTFDSPMAGVNAWRFPNLKGSVLWLPDRLEVTNATSGLYGGTARFDYKLAPLNERGVPTHATVGRHVSGRRPAAAHRLSRDTRTSAGRQRLGPEPSPLGSRQVEREARRRGSVRYPARLA